MSGQEIRQENPRTSSPLLWRLHNRWSIGLLIASAVILSVAMLGLRLYNTDYTETDQERLNAWATAMAAEMGLMLEKRRDDATILGVSSSIAYVISEDYQSGNGPLGGDWLKTRLQAEHEYRDIDTVAVLDLDGYVIEYAGKLVPSEEWFRSAVVESIKSEKSSAIEISDPAHALSYWWLVTFEAQAVPVGVYAQSVEMAPFVERVLARLSLPGQTDVISVAVPHDAGWHLYSAENAEAMHSEDELRAAAQRIGLPAEGFEALPGISAGVVGERTAAAPVSGSNWVVVAYVPAEVVADRKTLASGYALGASLILIGLASAVFWFWRRDALFAESEHRAAVRAEEALEAQDRFMTNMSHEFMTPLNAIMGFSQVLLSGMAGDINPEQSRQLEMVDQGAKRILVLVEDVLDIAKIKAGEIQVHPSEFTVRELTDAVRPLMYPLAEERGLECFSTVPDGDITLRTDRSMVERILINLVSNAIKFTDEGFVRMTVRRAAGDAVSFAVHDSGRGIPAESIDEVMQDFRQVVEPQGVKPVGTGLGLAISKRMAQMLGGDLEVHSELGVGSTFTLTIPCEYHGDADGQRA